jgi:hypothetical protein
MEQTGIKHHRETLIDVLRNEIIETAEDEKRPFYTAATRVLLSWLGYPLQDITFIDSKDNGIDAWYPTDSSTSDISIEIFQIKTHELTSEGLLCLDPFDNAGVNDLIRAKNLLCSNENGSTISNKNIKELLGHWSYIIRNRKVQEIPSAMLVTLNFVILGNSLTPQAQEEFARFQKSNEDPAIIKDVVVQFNPVLYTIDSIIQARWRAENRDWKDFSGNKKDYIVLKPLKTKGGRDSVISDNKNAVFYCPAVDLVDAYQALGYQLFEPNVRAEIKKSRVNNAIRDSVKHSRSRRDFRFLNNGVTMTCKSYRPIAKGEKGVKIEYPGIVNGLQTVVALHTAYRELSERDKEDFKKNCSVLVRLLNKNAVDDITDVVRATNNQNPMQPRNLVSNNPEQIGFAHIFAEKLEWFYEAKEGAWNAFEKDYRRWRPSLNKTDKDFKTKGKGSRIRKVDNHLLAQTWLSFIGFSSVAAEERAKLFESKLYYNLIFNKRTSGHGFDYDYNPKFASDDAEQAAPSAHLMLAAYLSYQFAKSVVPTPQQNRKEACERLGLDINESSTIELDIKLVDKDNAFALNQALRHMPLLFTEVVGFILYRVLGKNIHNHGQEIISNHSFDFMRREFNPELIKQKIDNRTFEKNDLLVILWLMFFDKIGDLMVDNWGKKGYRKADRKSRFVLLKESRNRLYEEIQNLDEFMKQRQLLRPWTIGVEEKQGFFEFIKKCVFDKSARASKEPELFKRL